VGGAESLPRLARSISEMAVVTVFVVVVEAVKE